MLFVQLGQRRCFQSLLISFAVVLRVPAADSQVVSLTCTDFARKEITSCVCTVKTPPDFLLTSATTNGTEKMVGSKKCSAHERNSAYITIGEKPHIAKGSPFQGSPRSRCVCCFKDFMTGERYGNIRYSTPQTTCKVERSSGNVRVMNASFLVSEELAKVKHVFCVLPCLPGKANVTVRLMDEALASSKSLSTLIIIVASSVSGIIALSTLTMVMTYFIVQHQRKQAWVVYENKPTRPAPLPTIQNSGLIYIVDPRGLVLPLLEPTPEEVEASEIVPGLAGPRSKSKRSTDRQSLAAKEEIASIPAI